MSVDKIMQGQLSRVGQEVGKRAGLVDGRGLRGYEIPEKAATYVREMLQEVMDRYEKECGADPVHNIAVMSGLVVLQVMLERLGVRGKEGGDELDDVVLKYGKEITRLCAELIRARSAGTTVRESRVGGGDVVRKLGTVHEVRGTSIGERMKGVVGDD